MRSVWGIAAVVALLLGLTACGQSSSPAGGGGAGNGAPATSGAVATNTVAIKNFTFVPMVITVKAGTAVTWTNQDASVHTATADNKSFDSDNLAQGKSYSYTFAKPGTYDYFCEIHQYMKGTVIVQ